MTVGIRYCGGCNPRYDRTAATGKLITEIPGVVFSYDAGMDCDIWLLVCGCPAACVSEEGLQGREIIRISEQKQFIHAATRIRSYMKEKLADKSIVKKRILCVGETAFLEKAFSEEEVRAYAKISLDENPIHLDPEFAAKGLFRRPVVHGILAVGLLSSVMGTMLPGSGTILTKEQIRFLHPVYPGEIIRAEITFLEYQEERRYYTGVFAGKLLNEDGVVLAEGWFNQMMLKKQFVISGSKTDPQEVDDDKS